MLHWTLFFSQEKEEKRKREQFPLTPEQLALATEMVTSKLSKRNLEERMYDRYAFNDPEGLPEWFTEQEKKHRFRRAPQVSKVSLHISVRFLLFLVN